MAANKRTRKTVDLFSHDTDVWLNSTDECIEYFTNLKSSNLDASLHVSVDRAEGELTIIGTEEDLTKYIKDWYHIKDDDDEFDFNDYANKCGRREVK